MEASEALNPTPEPSPDPVADPSPQGEEQAPQEATPDVREQVSALAEEIRALREANAPPKPEGLYERLAGDQGEPVAEEDGQSSGHDDPDDPGLYDDDSLLYERVAEQENQELQELRQQQESLVAYVRQQELDRREAELTKLANKYPDLVENDEVLSAVQGTLRDRAARYGVPPEQILTDPREVEEALLLAQAERSTADEVPAAEAAQQGTQIETAAGAAAATSEPSPEEQIKQAILGAGGGRDAFT